MFLPVIKHADSYNTFLHSNDPRAGPVTFAESDYMQVITYREYLPNVLGPEQMKRFNLNLDIDSRGRYKYRDDVDPTATNVFGVAAFRFGHAEIQFGTTPKERYYLP